MTDADWNDFAALVSAYFDARGETAEISAGTVFLNGDTTRPMSLGNLAAACANRERADWTGLIANHFDTLRRSVEAEQDVARKARVFADVRSSLMLRIYDEGSTPFTDQLYVRQDLEGTDTFVVFDLPDSVLHVNRAHTRTWGLTDEEVFMVAEQNLNARPFPKRAMDPGPFGQQMHVFQGDVYTASNALREYEMAKYDGAYGSLVAIPSREVLMIHPIEGPASRDVFVDLGIYASKVFLKYPGAITPFLFWHHKGAFTRCGSGSPTVDEMKPSVPEALTRLLYPSA